MGAARLFGVLALAGLALFGWCAARHVCCGGHLAHPPYAAWDYALDAGWAGLFVAAAGFGLAARRWLGPALLLALAGSRLALGSGSGYLLLPVELPVTVVAAGTALAAAVGPRSTTADPAGRAGGTH
ncbi:MAG: hypothetical protein J2P46_19235 [Zavarzinella sp.]|nr:hypothetical protein [Zavarzinella sp.]